MELAQSHKVMSLDDLKFKGVAEYPPIPKKSLILPSKKKFVQSP